ncbi:hypothetical protein ABW19_dt0201468 [Dactylella cylindrospora]|nr:hypothetical protein ABW19_dt0201468 [Dactylella cylindrospora]
MRLSLGSLLIFPIFAASLATPPQLVVRKEDYALHKGGDFKSRVSASHSWTTRTWTEEKTKTKEWKTVTNTRSRSSSPTRKSHSHSKRSPNHEVVELLPRDDPGRLHAIIDEITVKARRDAPSAQDNVKREGIWEIVDNNIHNMKRESVWQLLAESIEDPTKRSTRRSVRDFTEPAEENEGLKKKWENAVQIADENVKRDDAVENSIHVLEGDLKKRENVYDEAADIVDKRENVYDEAADIVDKRSLHLHRRSNPARVRRVSLDFTQPGVEENSKRNFLDEVGNVFAPAGKSKTRRTEMDFSLENVEAHSKHKRDFLEDVEGGLSDENPAAYQKREETLAQKMWGLWHN